MNLPPPVPNQAYVTVSALEAGRVNMYLDQLVDVAAPGERVDLPTVMFLLKHSVTGDHFLFDLGIRTDVEALPCGTAAKLRDMGIKLQVQPDVRGALAKGGLAPEQIKHVCISHIHYDHTGDPSLFPESTFLLGADARPVIEKLTPNFDGTIYAIDVPPDRTRFLETAGWPPLGSFAHALDFYGDGSVYVVDAAGHVPGHLNVLARTSPDGGWILLAADSVHDWRVIDGAARFAHHPIVGCIHQDPETAWRHVERIRELRRDSRVRVLLAHDIPWYEKNRGGPAFWPGSIESL
ncbi:beta-lactamase-like protein [Trametes elegans]|nr:beta-lactamase-like protein [Trametes elegans]